MLIAMLLVLASTLQAYRYIHLYRDIVVTDDALTAYFAVNGFNKIFTRSKKIRVTWDQITSANMLDSTSEELSGSTISGDILENVLHIRALGGDLTVDPQLNGREQLIKILEEKGVKNNWSN